MDKKTQIAGTLLGGAVGDALGAPVEFMSRDRILDTYPPAGVCDYVDEDGLGRITDDTQMALFTAEGVLRSGIRPLAPDAPLSPPMRERLFRSMADSYRRWFLTQNRIGIDERFSAELLQSGWLISHRELFAERAPGMTCLSAIGNPRFGDRSAYPLNDSKGCGSVMRTAPIGLLLPPEIAFEVGCDASELTHCHRTGILAGGAMAMLIAELLTERSLSEAVDAVLNRLANESDAEETTEALKNAVALARSPEEPATAIEKLGGGWIAEEALGIAVYCALKFCDDFCGGVLAAVNITGDSDSTGAITGNILGAALGVGAISPEWLDALVERRIVAEMADDIAAFVDKDVEPTEAFRKRYPICEK